jgi:CheY-like chemotaxis protein
MILDDETDIVYIFRKSLELTGYGVFAFNDPKTALEHFKANADRYGLIVTDVRMPNLTGIEFANEIRNLNSDIPIILMSAFAMKDLEISPSLKIAELLQKPVTTNQLKGVVSKYVVAVSNSTASLPT